VVKSELLRILKEQCPALQPSDVELALNCLLEHMITGLANGERIEVRGFGSFNLHSHPPRKSRNPKTGATFHLPAKVAVHFKPSIEMKDRVNTARNNCPITD
jgi:integration host factor subunit beta